MASKLFPPNNLTQPSPPSLPHPLSAPISAAQLTQPQPPTSTPASPLPQSPRSPPCPTRARPSPRRHQTDATASNGVRLSPISPLPLSHTFPSSPPLTHAPTPTQPTSPPANPPQTPPKSPPPASKSARAPSTPCPARATATSTATTTPSSTRSTRSCGSRPPTPPPRTAAARSRASSCWARRTRRGPPRPCCRPAGWAASFGGRSRRLHRRRMARL